MNIIKHRGYKLKLDYYMNMFTTEESEYIYDKLFEIVKPTIQKGKRTKSTLSFGVKGLVYTIKWYGKVTERRVIDWDDYPIIQEIRKRVENETGYTFNTCGLHLYLNGNYGINPHRDREMKPGTVICGLTFGEERLLNMSLFKKDILNIRLLSGSCYIFRPPTNDYYFHSIVKEKDRMKPRISITFRTY